MTYTIILFAALGVVTAWLFISEHDAWCWRSRFETLRDSVMEFPYHDIGELQELADDLTPREGRVDERIIEWARGVSATLTQRERP